MNPASSKLMTGRQWNVTMRHMLTGRTLINGLGYIEKEKMTKTRDLLFKYMKLKGKLAVEDIYSNRFLPSVFVK